MAAESPKTGGKARKKTDRRGCCLGRLLLLAIVLGAAGVGWVNYLWTAPSTSFRLTRVRVPGSGTLGAGRALQRAGLVRSAWAFLLYVHFHGGSRPLKAGVYKLSPDMGPDRLVKALEFGQGRISTRGVRVTIPEGYTLRQIAAALQEQGVTDAKKFIAAGLDKEKLRRMPINFPPPPVSAEGYLFPDTYDLGQHMPADQVLQEMVTNFDRRFARPYHQQITASSRSLNDIVTEASLIEREAKVPQDRPAIAGVIDNRLAKGMRLEVDATVLYALGHHKNRVTYRDLEVDSRYNTYRHKGLPPGAIANPGLASLEAVLEPHENPYLYYVARPDGSHLFTRTMAEHLAAIRKARAERQRTAAPGGG